MAGIDGPVGASGATGADGVVGATGASGPTGATGSMYTPWPSQFEITNTSTAFHNTSGAFLVTGGVGIQGDVFAGQLLNIKVSGSAPSSLTVGSFAVADAMNWDPGSKGMSANPYPVFYNGTNWIALY
jgi:hypothetical protein